MKSNNFIVVEGFDGSGKTSIAKWLETDLGYTYTKSPTGAFALARELFDDVDCIPLRDRLAFYTGDCIRISELLRSECLEEKVVLDRYYPSTVCYHEALSPGSTKNLHSIFEQLYQPDIILYLKTDYDVLTERLKNRENSLNDRLVKPDFYRKVEEQYKRYENLPFFFVIENNGTPAETQRKITELLHTV